MIRIWLVVLNYGQLLIVEAQQVLSQLEKGRGCIASNNEAIPAFHLLRQILAKEPDDEIIAELLCLGLKGTDFLMYLLLVLQCFEDAEARLRIE